jgi:hypothetical protein
VLRQACFSGMELQGGWNPTLWDDSHRIGTVGFALLHPPYVQSSTQQNKVDRVLAWGQFQLGVLFVNSVLDHDIEQVRINVPVSTHVLENLDSLREL